MPNGSSRTGATTGGPVRRTRWVVLMVALAAGTAALVPSGAVAAPRQSQPLQDSEVGVSNDTIRIAVIADVDNPVRPGLFQGVVSGVRAFAKFINGRGGLAGRKVQVDFIDSHLSADEARNALIRACQEDFAIVGTTALFLNDISPMTGCQDKAGGATGLPDVPLVQTEESHQCSPVSYPVLANQLVCSTRDQHPQTYFVKSGQVRYFEPGTQHCIFNIGKIRIGITICEDAWGAEGFLPRPYPIQEGKYKYNKHVEDQVY